MHRLLQGDVGSGKTVVAALAASRAIDAGWQCALMAPTKILAEQRCKCQACICHAVIGKKSVGIYTYVKSTT